MITNVAIIPARGGSVRIPRKNIKRFHGRPIIAYSIRTARRAGIERVIVSTDDADIAVWAEWFKCEVHHRCHDDGARGTQEVTAMVISEMGLHAPFVCCIYPTAPLMLPVDLTLGLERLKPSRQSFVYSTNARFEDAGQWYWGRSEAFGTVPLDAHNAIPYVIPDARVCDINTPEDWERAEELYERLHAIQAA